VLNRAAAKLKHAALDALVGKLREAVRG